MKDRIESHSLLRTVLFLAIPVIALLFGILLTIWTQLPSYARGVDSEGLQKAGQFGDMFGAANALFSGLAFLGITLALFFQWHDLKEVRFQLFDSTFFQLLSLHNQNTASLTASQKDRFFGAAALSKDEYMGRDCFKGYHELLMARLSLEQRLSKESCVKAYESLYEEIHGNVGPYFRNLYHIIMFVKESCPGDDARKKRYTSIVRAQLSSYEQALLFYNCISRLGKDKFLPLVERFSLLENMSDHLLLPQQASWIKGDAFGDDAKALRTGVLDEQHREAPTATSKPT